MRTNIKQKLYTILARARVYLDYGQSLTRRADVHNTNKPYNGSLRMEQKGQSLTITDNLQNRANPNNER